jgi:hypothetical protein
MACLCEKRGCTAEFRDLEIEAGGMLSSPFFTGIYYIFFFRQIE